MTCIHSRPLAYVGPQLYLYTPHSTNVENQIASREPSPNRVASVPDTAAIGSERESQAEWQKRCGIEPEKQVRLVKLAHMRYQHPDLAEITKFLRGMSCVVVSALVHRLKMVRSRFRYARGQKDGKPEMVSRLWSRPVCVLCSERAEKIPRRCLPRRNLPRSRKVRIVSAINFTN